MKKAIFFDVDNTLLDHHRGTIISDNTLFTLKTLKEKGHSLFIATGRSYFEYIGLKDLTSFPFDGYLFMNGQVAMDKDFNKLFTYQLDSKDIPNIIKAFNGEEVMVLVSERGHYCNHLNQYIKDTYEAIGIDIIREDTYQDEEIYMACLCGEYDIKGLQARFPNCCVSSWRECAFDINALEGDKGKAMLKMLDIYTFRQEDSVAFGDGDNDAGLLKEANLGIAMGNGSFLAKHYADEIALPIYEEGLLKIAQKYNFFI